MKDRMHEKLKYTFSADELRELGAALAREAQGIYDRVTRRLR